MFTCSRLGNYESTMNNTVQIIDLCCPQISGRLNISVVYLFIVAILVQFTSDNMFADIWTLAQGIVASAGNDFSITYAVEYDRWLIKSMIPLDVG